MRQVIVAVLGVVVLASGCGSDSGGTTAVGPSATGRQAPAQSAPVSSAAVPRQLKFEGTTLAGKPFSGSSLGGRPVVFWFWAPWCPKCQAEGPSVAKAAAKYGDRVSFVGIGGLDGSKDRLNRFVSRTGTGGITHLDDRTGKLYAHFKVTSQSSFVFMAPDGTTTKDSGPLTESALTKHLDKLLG